MTRDQIIAHLQRLKACQESILWARTTNAPPGELWRQCCRGDWMIWLADFAGADRRLVVLAACDCAELAREYAPLSDGAPSRRAIETARAWCRGEATIGNVRRAAYSANSASYTACYATYAVNSAAACAAKAAYATDFAHLTASYAAGVGDHITAGAGVTRSKSLARAAQIIRRRIKWADVSKGLKP